MAKGTSNKTPHAAGQSMVVQSVPRSQIHADDSFNSRKRYNGVEELADDIAKFGLIAPVILRPVKGGYSLVAGFRRLRALDLLKWENVPALVNPSLTEDQAQLVNLKENMARRSLTTYEVAMALMKLAGSDPKAQKMTGAALAAQMASGEAERGEGMTKDYVNNLLRCARNLHPDILKQWEAGNGAATTNFLVKLAAMEQEEQLEAWKTATGGAPGEDSEGGEGGEGGESNPSGGKKAKRQTEANMVAALAAVKKDAKLGESEKEGMVAALRFCMGKAKKLVAAAGNRVVYDPKGKKKGEETED